MFLTDENLIIYKISCEGTLESIESQKLLESFTPIDALAIYIYNNKRLYVWKGKHIDLIVGKYVPEAKDLILKKDSDIRILRHIVVESESEPQDFFDDLDLQPKSLKSQLEKAEKVYNELNEKLEKLKTIAKDLLARSAYDQAMEKAQELITLGSKLNKLSLIKEQQQFIAQVQETKLFKEKHEEDFELNTRQKNEEAKIRQLAEDENPRIAEDQARKQCEEEQKRLDAEEQARKQATGEQSRREAEEQAKKLATLSSRKLQFAEEDFQNAFSDRKYKECLQSIPEITQLASQLNKPEIVDKYNKINQQIESNIQQEAKLLTLQNEKYEKINPLKKIAADLESNMKFADAKSKSNAIKKLATEINDPLIVSFCDQEIAQIDAWTKSLSGSDLMKWDITPFKIINRLRYNYVEVLTDKVAAQKRAGEITEQSGKSDDVKVVAMQRSKFKGQGPYNEKGECFTLYVRKLVE